MGRPINRVVRVRCHFYVFTSTHKKLLSRKEVRTGRESDCIIDDARLERDVASAVAALNRDGYEVVSMTPLTSGNHRQNGSQMRPSGQITGWGYGWSYTDSVLIVGRLAA